MFNSENANDVKVFISYSHKDERFRESLEEHLSILRRTGKIASWNDRKITAGADWAGQIDHNIEIADIILLLISSSFVSSSYCMDKELGVALDRQQAETATVIPIFVRPTDLEGAPFMALQGLPRDQRPVSLWEDEDTAWLQVAKGIRTAADEISARKKRLGVVAKPTPIHDVMNAYVDTLSLEYQLDAAITGMRTNLVDFDRMIDGLHRGTLVAVASRPSMGKTNFCLGIALTVAEDMPVVVFSTRTSEREVTERLLTISGKLNGGRLRRGRLLDDEWPALVGAVQRVSDSTMLLDDTVHLTLESLRERCIDAKSRFGALPLVVIDSVHYLEAENAGPDNALTIARSLKRLARELNCCILVTVQVGRALEQRPNKRPVQSDLQAWADFGDESDVLAFLYVDSLYNPDTRDIGTAEVIIARNRRGPMGPIRVAYDPPTGTFDNFTVAAAPD
ncbi:TIR domain-containing protein [Caballeronia arationis]|uniref:TIR domain-containing protein n=1 Tax=Caballeronia arationis TaxID=1777142 RepID=A0A7Z7I9T9_9BURK|nr:DnaB-like helicase C-terminal domain-containing protein [Caballeronia arationis]SOE81977.1 TIR domain-containing protein [Caballeronia arationis]